MPAAPRVSAPAAPTLIVRLPNHLGDACMALPALELLARAGPLALAGQPWAADLLRATAWPCLGLGATRGARVAALRAWRLAHAPARQGLLLTNSFSSALEFRLAGLRPAGYARDGRSLLLHPAYALPRAGGGALHAIDVYLHLARSYLGSAGPAQAADPVPRLALPAEAQARARAALQRAGVAPADPGPVVLCPVARGRHRGQVKSWDGYGRLAQELRRQGAAVVVCPGPGEAAAARAAAPAAVMLEALDVGAFAALLAASSLVVANDSGPAHLAAAVGATVLVVHGVTDPAQTGPRGARVHGAGSAAGWPDYAAVATLAAALRGGAPVSGSGAAT
jgi:heptosyltransferase-2